MARQPVSVMREVTIYSSSPASSGAASARYIERIREVAGWSERHGCRGILIYTGNGPSESWVLAQHVVVNTTSLVPLIAVQPVYAHPFTVAKKIAALGLLYDRPVDINLVAGGFQFDLAALGDLTDHDARYERLNEYGTIVLRLIREQCVSFDGRYYKLTGAALGTRSPVTSQLRVTVSGSSPAGKMCAERLGATAVMYPVAITPEVSGVDASLSGQTPSGVRLGVIARGTSHQAWQEAILRFPETKAGRMMQQAAGLTSDSSWLKQLSADLGTSPDRAGPYWLGPFRNSYSFCPYLVGSHEEVGEYLASYIKAGASVFILDCPREERDLVEFNHALRIALIGGNS